MKTKKSFLFIYVVAILFYYSQSVKAQLPIDKETNKVKFTNIVDLPLLSKDKIYKKAKLWIVSTLKSGDNMVELSGDNSDQIIGTGNILLDSLKIEKYIAQDAILNFKFIIFCKDNKLKYSVENFNLHYEYALHSYNTELEEIKSPEYISNKYLVEFNKQTPIYLKKKIDNLIADFIYSMKKTESDDW